MPKENKKSSISIHMFLSETITEKLVIIALTALTSLSSTLVYVNYQQNKLPQTQTVEIIEDTVE